MKILSQNDKAWAIVKLGSSKLTVARYGCTTVCLSMLSDYFRGFVSPLQLAHNAMNYTADGLIIWKNLLFPTMQFMRREYGENPTTIKQALKDPDMACILQVNDGQHWVVALRKSLMGNDWLVADPWNAKKIWAKRVYRNVTGAAFFKRSV